MVFSGNQKNECPYLLFDVIPMFTSTSFRVFLFCCLLCIALLELRIAVVAQTAYSGVSRNKSIQKYQQQPRFLVAYGRQAILGSGQLKVAKQWYQKALIVNPHYIPAWIALSELYNDEGDSTSALTILEYIDGKMEDVVRWRWDKTMLAYQLNRLDILSTDLSWLLQQEKVSGKTKTKAVKLAFSLWPKPEDLLREMGRNNIDRLFLQAIRTKNLTTADYLWPTVDQANPETNKVLPYINLLIHNKEISNASLIWKKYYPTDSLIYNGTFSQSPVNSGFGWRFYKIAGAELVLPSSQNKNEVHLKFNGTENINYYHIRQVVALSSEHSYELSGQIRSRGITTEQKPFIDVVGLHCSMVATQTNMVPADQEWTPFSLTFTVPEQCEAVQIRVRRKPSTNIDNLINGDLWLSDFSMTPIILGNTQLNISTLEILSGSEALQDNR